MRVFGWIFGLLSFVPGPFLPMLAVFNFSAVSFASERTNKYYRIAESREALESSPYVLTITSGDLNRFPKSVVTISVTTEHGREPNALLVAEKQVPSEVFGRRHYVRLGDHEFGRRGTPVSAHVKFDVEAGTVFVPFIGKVGTTYFYKPLTSMSASLAQRQMPRLDRSETR